MGVADGGSAAGGVCPESAERATGGGRAKGKLRTLSTYHIAGCGCQRGTERESEQRESSTRYHQLIILLEMMLLYAGVNAAKGKRQGRKFCVQRVRACKKKSIHTLIVQP